MKIQGKLSIQRIKTSNDWPKLKAKAAAVRHLAAYALELCVRYGGATVHDDRRRAVCQLLARFYEIIGSDERWLNESHLLELRELSVLLVRTYLKLSAEALKNKVRAWKAVPKFHVFQHICEIQAAVFGNPRRYWTYSEEDLQRIMKMIALSVHTENVPPLALYKWLTLLFEDA